MPNNPYETKSMYPMRKGSLQDLTEDKSIYKISPNKLRVVNDLSADGEIKAGFNQ